VATHRHRRRDKMWIRFSSGIGSLLVVSPQCKRRPCGFCLPHIASRHDTAVETRIKHVAILSCRSRSADLRGPRICATTQTLRPMGRGTSSTTLSHAHCSAAHHSASSASGAESAADIREHSDHAEVSGSTVVIGQRAQESSRTSVSAMCTARLPRAFRPSPRPLVRMFGRRRRTSAEHGHGSVGRHEQRKMSNRSRPWSASSHASSPAAFLISARAPGCPRDR